VSTWKHAERQVAAIIGGERIPINGRGDQPDIAHDIFAPEVKHRKKLPQWLHNFVAQAERSAGEGQLSFVVLHEKGKRYQDSYVVLRLKDFNDWYGYSPDGLDQGRSGPATE